MSFEFGATGGIGLVVKSRVGRRPREALAEQPGDHPTRGKRHTEGNDFHLARRDPLDPKARG
jgi:hypothetical protein